MYVRLKFGSRSGMVIDMRRGVAVELVALGRATEATEEEFELEQKELGLQLPKAQPDEADKRATVFVRLKVGTQAGVVTRMRVDIAKQLLKEGRVGEATEAEWEKQEGIAPPSPKPEVHLPKEKHKTFSGNPGERAREAKAENLGKAPRTPGEIARDQRKPGAA